MVVKALANSKSAVGWLPQDKPVDVLSINYASHAGTRYLIWSQKQHCAALFPSSEFNIIDPELPPKWRAVLDLNGNVELTPCEWTGDFWDRYHESDEAAIEIFKRVFREMYENCPL